MEKLSSGVFVGFWVTARISREDFGVNAGELVGPIALPFLAIAVQKGVYQFLETETEYPLSVV